MKIFTLITKELVELNWTSFFKRFLYAIKLKDIKLLISQNIHQKSRLMFDRNVHLIPVKSHHLLPMITILTLLLIKMGDWFGWLMDTHVVNIFHIRLLMQDDTNYIRNSVIATVDAYSGDVNFYIKDANDPIINGYANVFIHSYLSH